MAFPTGPFSTSKWQDVRSTTKRHQPTLVFSVAKHWSNWRESEFCLWSNIQGFFFKPRRFSAKKTLQVHNKTTKHGTWKSTTGKGEFYWKQPSGSMLKCRVVASLLDAKMSRKTGSIQGGLFSHMLGWGLNPLSPCSLLVLKSGR